MPPHSLSSCALAVEYRAVAELKPFKRNARTHSKRQIRIAEMSLVALSLGIEVAFVAAHHIIRVVIVMVGATPAFALLRREM